MIGWTGTISSIIGSFAVALGAFLAGYILFLIGSMSWLWVAITRRDTSLGVLNLFFLAANIIGLYRAI